MAHPKGPGLHYCHPALPNALLLPSPLRPGAEISIQGKVPARTRRFSFNLQRGTEKKTADVVFHFNPRFEEGSVVVRNSRIEGSWGEEERTLPTEFPFTYKENFCVVIKATEECFHVLVNDSPFISFNHRAPLETATHFAIKGEVKIYAVSFPQPLSSHLVSSIPGNLKLGDMIFVNGRLPDSSSRFKVNVQTGPKEDDDVILHVNPRLDEGVVVRNSRIEGQWGAEENSGGMPISSGDQFSFILASLQDRFQMYVNGNHFANYNYRTPIENGSFLYVDGSINLYNVIIESPAHKVYPPTGQAKIKPEQVISQEFNPLVPANVSIPGGLQPGRLLLITGMPTSDCTKFEINLVNGENENILFHFNPRFNEGSQIVRNSRLGGSWGDEERETKSFPFECGAHFDVVIVCEEANLQIWVNGEHVCDFTHRDNPALANILNISGPLFVKRILLA